MIRSFFFSAVRFRSAASCGAAAAMLILLLFPASSVSAYAAGTCFVHEVLEVNGVEQDSTDKIDLCSRVAPGLKGISGAKCYNVTKTNATRNGKTVTTYDTPEEVHCADGSTIAPPAPAGKNSTVTQSGISGGSLPTTHGDNSAVKRGLDIVFGLAGAIALLIIVVAGLRYVTSDGNPSNIEQAKSAIIYAVVGLLITLAAFSIVNFVVQGVG